MVINDSKDWPPLSTAVKEVQKKFKLLEKEVKEIQKQQVQLRKDGRNGTITQDQSDELDEKLSARSNEIQTKMFVLVQKMGDLK